MTRHVSPDFYQPIRVIFAMCFSSCSCQTWPCRFWFSGNKCFWKYKSLVSSQNQTTSLKIWLWQSKGYGIFGWDMRETLTIRGFTKSRKVRMNWRTLTAPLSRGLSKPTNWGKCKFAILENRTITPWLPKPQLNFSYKWVKNWSFVSSYFFSCQAEV